MGCLRPATPGFVVTLVATILLVVVSFCVPYFKTVFFLKANVSVGGVNGSITFGTLGYCLELPGNTTCSKPSVGYELDINSLVGNNLPIEIPNVVVKWLTYALVLHIVALALSAGSAVFGLLAHVREMSMVCCSTWVSGLAATVALLAFIFDLALFFLARARIDKVQGGSAEIGNAIWLTLAAWVLLFFSGCFYSFGRCCISKRKPRGDWNGSKGTEPYPAPTPAQNPDQSRLDAVKAEADRKARQKATEGGLPAFYETQPLTARIDGDSVYVDDGDHPTVAPYRDHNNIGAEAAVGTGVTAAGGYSRGGYVQAPPGTRAVDEYYNPSGNAVVDTYPPQPQTQRQASTHTVAPSTYAPSTYGSPPPLVNNNNQYLSANPQQYTRDSYNIPGQEYGHTAGGTTYHSAASHQQYPSDYSQYNPFDAHATRAQSPVYTSALYGAPQPPTGYSSNPQSYYPQPPQQHPDRSYTLGGGGYGESSVPDSTYYPYPSSSPAPINTNVAAPAASTSPVRGPRAQRTMSPLQYDDNPPGYDTGSSQAFPGAWGKH